MNSARFTCVLVPIFEPKHILTMAAIILLGTYIGAVS